MIKKKKNRGIFPLKIKEIKIKYDGEFPNRCSGTLIVTIASEDWIFPLHCMHSGGSVSFDENWSEEVTQGEWSIDPWPKDFPEHLKDEVLRKINEQIPWGCCGGCV